MCHCMKRQLQAVLIAVPGAHRGSGSVTRARPGNPPAADHDVAIVTRPLPGRHRGLRFIERSTSPPGRTVMNPAAGLCM